MEIIVGWVTTNGKISSMDLAFTAGSNMVSSEKEKWDEVQIERLIRNVLRQYVPDEGSGCQLTERSGIVTGHDPRDTPSQLDSLVARSPFLASINYIKESVLYHATVVACLWFCEAFTNLLPIFLFFSFSSFIFFQSLPLCFSSCTCLIFSPCMRDSCASFPIPTLPFSSFSSSPIFFSSSLYPLAA